MGVAQASAQPRGKEPATEPRLQSMSGYRDDVGAWQQRAQMLEQELQEAAARLAQQGATVAEQQAALQARGAEIAQLRAQLGAAPAVAPATGPRVCTACGHKNQPHYKFCLGCGKTLGPGDAPPGMAWSPSAGAEASPHLVAARSGSSGAMVVVTAVITLVIMAAGAAFFLLAR